jgi:hypothetical protein
MGVLRSTMVLHPTSLGREVKVPIRGPYKDKRSVTKSRLGALFLPTGRGFGRVPNHRSHCERLLCIPLSGWIVGDSPIVQKLGFPVIANIGNLEIDDVISGFVPTSKKPTFDFHQHEVRSRERPLPPAPFAQETPGRKCVGGAVRGYGAV